MRFDIINEDDLSYYEDLIPIVYRNYLELPAEIVVGAAEEDGEGSYFACGVMILSVADPSVIELRWLQVHPDYREREIGTLLLEQAFSLAKKMNSQRIVIRIPEINEDSIMFDDRSAFFVMRGFVRKSVIEREWLLSMYDIKDFEINNVQTSQGQFIPYSDLSMKDFTNKIDHIIKDKNFIPFVPGLIDRELSMSYISEGKLLAEIAIQKVGEVYNPVYFYVAPDNPQAGLELISTVLNDIKKKLNLSSLIHIQCRSEDRRNFVEKLFAEFEPINVSVLEAAPDAFDKASAAIEEELRLYDEAKKEDAEFPTKFKVVELEYYGGEVETFE